MAKSKKPAFRNNPVVSKQPKTKHQDQKTDKVIFSFVQFDGQIEWCKDAPSQHSVWEILDRVKNIERLGWTQLAANQDHHHPIPFTDLIKEAHDKAKKLRIDDYEEIWSFRFTGTQRLWGVKDNNHFLVIWWDPDHQICPASKKHT